MEPPETSLPVPARWLAAPIVLLFVGAGCSAHSNGGNWGIGFLSPSDNSQVVRVEKYKGTGLSIGPTLRAGTFEESSVSIPAYATPAADGSTGTAVRESVEQRPDGTVVKTLRIGSGTTASQTVLADTTRVDPKALEEALKIVGDFIERMCASIPLEGTGEQLQLSGDAKVALNGLLKKMADLRIEGAAKYADSAYAGVLQKDLVRALRDSAQCKLELWKDLKTAIPGLASQKSS